MSVRPPPQRRFGCPETATGALGANSVDANSGLLVIRGRAGGPAGARLPALSPPGLGANAVYRPLELRAVLTPLAMALAAELGLADPASAAFMLV